MPPNPLFLGRDWGGPFGIRKLCMIWDVSVDMVRIFWGSPYCSGSFIEVVWCFKARGRRDSSASMERCNFLGMDTEIHNERLCWKMLYPTRKREVVFQYLFIVRACVLVETAFSENKVSVHILFQDCSKFTNGQANMSYTRALHQNKSTKKLWILSLKNW